PTCPPPSRMTLRKRSRPVCRRLRASQPTKSTPTLYWLTNTGVSSARLYWESKLVFFAPKHVAIPVAVSVFPDEIYAAPRSWTERAYPRLIHFNKLAKGTHFAAWEQPEFFVSEMRAAFKSLR